MKIPSFLADAAKDMISKKVNELAKEFSDKGITQLAITTELKNGEFVNSKLMIVDKGTKRVKDINLNDLKTISV